MFTLATLLSFHKLVVGLKTGSRKSYVCFLLCAWVGFAVFPLKKIVFLCWGKLWGQTMKRLAVRLVFLASVAGALSGCVDPYAGAGYGGLSPYGAPAASPQLYYNPANGAMRPCYHVTAIGGCAHYG